MIESKKEETRIQKTFERRKLDERMLKSLEDFALKIWDRFFS